MTTIRMKGHEPDLAFWLMTSNDAACEIATLLGFAAVIIDMEHGTFEVASAARVVAYSKACGLRVFTRVDEAKRVAIQHALDSGADGVILPQIRDAEHAREAASYAKFPPLGVRGYGGGRTVNYLPAPHHFVVAENSRTQCWAMIETVRALEEVETIAALETIDGLFIGPNDLSLARGRGEYRADGRDHDDIRRIAEAANRNGKPWAMPVASAVDRRFTRSLGISFMAVTDDLTALRNGLEHATQSSLED
ncbi:MAG TPA: aldolase/citrate lyase family protein [Alphaproteobacteria bacterium]|nr:aldolase/citrate lyase family protein [Alphaproteobacteria bacterium]